MALHLAGGSSLTVLLQQGLAGCLLQVCVSRSWLTAQWEGLREGCVYVEGEVKMTALPEMVAVRTAPALFIQHSPCASRSCPEQVAAISTSISMLVECVE